MTQAQDTIEWGDMVDAGIDVTLVERLPDNYTPTWRATSEDGERRITFGVCFDANGVVPEGEHTGWDSMTECRDRYSDGWEPMGQDYFEPEDLAKLLAKVADVLKGELD